MANVRWKGAAPPITLRFLMDCDHQFVFLRTAKWEEGTGYHSTFHRVDTFFCQKCLLQKEVERKATARDTPDWYRD